ETPGLAQFDLLEHREGTDAELFVARVVVAIDRRERFVTAIDQSYADQLAVEQVAQFEGLAAAHDQELPVTFEIDAIAIAGEATQFLVPIVQFDAARVGDRIGDFDREPRVAALQRTTLGAIG